ncbi:hypothetical protein, partial [Thiorhodococcus fuscus]
LEVAASDVTETGAYTVTVATEADDYGNTTKTAGTIASEDPYPGEIQWANDQDWIKLSVGPLAIYRVRVTEGDGDSTQDLNDLVLRDSKGNALTDNVSFQSNGDVSTLAFFNDSNRVTSVYLDISGADATTLDLDYTVTAELYMEDDYIGGGGVDIQQVWNTLPASFWA